MSFAPIYLCGELTESRTLRRDDYHILACLVTVPAGLTLTIESGVTVKALQTAVDGQSVPAIVIKQGGRIMANGTPSAPITFTAIGSDISSEAAEVTDTASNVTVARRRMGKWGGLVIAGYAPTSTVNPMVEGLVGVPYGGTDPYDNSGVLSYIRIWHGGAVISPNNEINGLTLAGVGAGTRIENIEVRSLSCACRARALACMSNARLCVCAVDKACWVSSLQRLPFPVPGGLLSG